jgi:hypothetical protein
VYDLLVNGRLTGQGSVPGGNTLTIDMGTGTTDRQAGPAGTVSFIALLDPFTASGDPTGDSRNPRSGCHAVLGPRITGEPVQGRPGLGRHHLIGRAKQLAQRLDGPVDSQTRHRSYRPPVPVQVEQQEILHLSPLPAAAGAGPVRGHRRAHRPVAELRGR